MSGWIEIVKLFTLAVVIPLAVFSANWIWRCNKGYSQTAAADFILGMLIFDTTAVVAGTDFAPFMRSTELVPLITYWHFTVGFVSALVWWAITRWGEPILEAHYLGVPGVMLRRRFPIWCFLGCWVSVLILIAVHIGFFAAKHGGRHV